MLEQFQRDARQPSCEGEGRRVQGGVGPQPGAGLLGVAGEIAPLRVEGVGSNRLQPVVEQTQQRPQEGQLIPHPETEQAQVVLPVDLQGRLALPVDGEATPRAGRSRRSAAS